MQLCWVGSQWPEVSRLRFDPAVGKGVGSGDKWVSGSPNTQLSTSIKPKELVQCCWWSLCDDVHVSFVTPECKTKLRQGLPYLHSAATHPIQAPTIQVQSRAINPGLEDSAFPFSLCVGSCCEKGAGFVATIEKAFWGHLNSRRKPIFQPSRMCWGIFGFSHCFTNLFDQARTPKQIKTTFVFLSTKTADFECWKEHCSQWCRRGTLFWHLSILASYDWMAQ